MADVLAHDIAILGRVLLHLDLVCDHAQHRAEHLVLFLRAALCLDDHDVLRHVALHVCGAVNRRIWAPHLSISRAAETSAIARAPSAGLSYGQGDTLRGQRRHHLALRLGRFELWPSAAARRCRLRHFFVPHIGRSNIQPAIYDRPRCYRVIASPDAYVASLPSRRWITSLAFSTISSRTRPRSVLRAL
jgi:hypothetical protein